MMKYFFSSLSVNIFLIKLITIFLSSVVIMISVEIGKVIVKKN